MSIKQLERIKQQVNALSAKEKAELARFLAGSVREQAASTAKIASPKHSNEDLAEQRRRRQVWLSEHRAQYGGMYVAMDGDRLLGTGKNYPEAHAVAQRAGVPDAFIDFVPPPGYVGYAPDWE